MLKNREMSVLDREVDVGVEPKDLELVPFDAERVRVLFNQLEFRTLLPRILDALGAHGAAAAEAPESEAFEVEGVVARDAAAALAAMQAANTAPRVAAEARWAGRCGPERARGAVGGDRRRRASPTSTPSLLATPKVRAELEALASPRRAEPGRAPGQGARARPRTSTCARSRTTPR